MSDDGSNRQNYCGTGVPASDPLEPLLDLNSKLVGVMIFGFGSLFRNFSKFITHINLLNVNLRMISF